MPKYLKIENCGECPKNRFYPNANGYYCSETGFVTPETGIPEWCPLEEVKG